jgi:hypothetical protein
VAQPTASEHRPITVSTMIARLYHRLLAARLERDVPLNPRQKAFRWGDGLRDNIGILRSLLKDRCKKTMNTCAIFIDVAKAFDSVSHFAIIAAAERVGVPDRLLRYIERLYDGGATRLKSGSQMGSAFVVGRGVRQGILCRPSYLTTLWIMFCLVWI